MEFYDSDETKHESKEFAKKINDHLTKFRNMSEEDLSNLQTQYLDAINNFKTVIPPLLERAKKDELTEEEKELFMETFERFQTIKQGLEDTILLLGHSLKVQADGIFFNIKRQAANGDPKAKEIYDELLPKYKETLLSDNIEDLN